MAERIASGKAAEASTGASDRKKPPAGRSIEAPNTGRPHQRRAKMVDRPEDHPAGHAKPEGPVQHMVDARSIRRIAPGQNSAVASGSM
jgi:hypothetical protein